MLQGLVDALDTLHYLSPHSVYIHSVVLLRVHLHRLEPHQTGLDPNHIGEVLEYLGGEYLHLKEVRVSLACFPIHHHCIMPIDYKDVKFRT